MFEQDKTLLFGLFTKNLLLLQESKIKEGDRGGKNHVKTMMRDLTTDLSV
jgi:hypothetical protein